MWQNAFFSGIPITEPRLEARCCGAWVASFQTGRVVPFVKFQVGQAIKQGAIHLESLIPKVGLEPTPSCEEKVGTRIALLTRRPTSAKLLPTPKGEPPMTMARATGEYFGHALVSLH